MRKSPDPDSKPVFAIFNIYFRVIIALFLASPVLAQDTKPDQSGYYLKGGILMTERRIHASTSLTKDLLFRRAEAYMNTTQPDFSPAESVEKESLNISFPGTIEGQTENLSRGFTIIANFMIDLTFRDSGYSIVLKDVRGILKHRITILSEEPVNFNHIYLASLDSAGIKNNKRMFATNLLNELIPDLELWLNNFQAYMIKGTLSGLKGTKRNTDEICLN